MKLIKILLACILSAFALQAKTVYIQTSIGGLEVFLDPYSYFDERSKPFWAFREMLLGLGYDVRFTGNGITLFGGGEVDWNEAAAVISFNGIHPTFIENISGIPREKRFLFVFEPPTVDGSYYHPILTEGFGKIFTMFDDYVDNKNYFKFYYPQPRNEVRKPHPSFSEKKKLCTSISSNKGSYNPYELYSARREYITFFLDNHPEDFDLYGIGWHGYPHSCPPTKWDTIQNYKFCFCYDNMKNQRGYITEKIFDVMVAGSVPIYLGATNIQDYIPKECFVDVRDFSSLEDLYQFLKNIDEVQYQSYLDAIDNYYKSPKSRLFSIENFLDIVKDALKEVDPDFPSSSAQQL